MWVGDRSLQRSEETWQDECDSYSVSRASQNKLEAWPDVSGLPSGTDKHVYAVQWGERWKFTEMTAVVKKSIEINSTYLEHHVSLIRKRRGEMPRASCQTSWQQPKWDICDGTQCTTDTPGWLRSRRSWRGVEGRECLPVDSFKTDTETHAQGWCPLA